MVQLASARLSEREVSGSIFSDFQRLLRLSSDPCSHSFEYR